MIVKSLELRDFRNYDMLDIHFEEGTNILYGDNAQGKTNVLEAIYLSGTTKSHKGSKDREMIRFSKEESHLRAFVDKGGKEFQIDIHLKKNKTKGIAVNKIPIRKASELFGILNIVFFSPEDLNIIKNGPKERRRFLDLELCQLNKIYLAELTRYNKILSQRNKLLKDIYFRPELKDTLSVWDMQLLEYGRKVIAERRKFVEDLNDMVTEIHAKISGGKEEMILKYEPNVEEENFEMELKNSLARDLKLGQTSAGPHKDDLSFRIKDIDIRRFGSQGQQRTCALSLKLAEIELVRKIIKDSPVLLLDDVLSELDGSRQNYLLNNINGTQTIITCTGLDEFVKNRFELNKVFHVVEGQIFEESSE
ncbi:MAG: DNA replication/repair protein RecF [Lachnospiraceae bacterium]|nr:DNA replication/repair protein RecF [Lachnospiraceae bacterium]